MKAVDFLFADIDIMSKLKEDKIYTEKIICDINKDFCTLTNELSKYKVNLDKAIEKVSEIEIDDAFLLIKATEHSETIDKLLKKCKRASQKELKTIKDIYERYNLVMDIASFKLITKDFINRINNCIRDNK